MDLPDLRDYHRLRQGFGWHLPDRYNIGVDVCDRWARLDPARPAILDWTAAVPRTITYGDLCRQSNRFANLLVRLGIERGDRVALILPQGPDVVSAHIAIYKIGAIALPMAAVFGFDGLAYRLADSGAVACVTDAAGATTLDTVTIAEPPALGRSTAITTCAPAAASRRVASLPVPLLAPVTTT